MGLDIVNPPPAFLFVPTIVIFDASATWIVPPGVSKIYAQPWGGGGSGGGGTGSVARAGSGGGGEYRAGTLVTSPGESLTITIGLGGAGVAQGNDGNPGGNTNIKRGGTILLEAKGGGAGLQSGVHGAGGTGGTGTEGIDGQNGLTGGGGNSPKGGWGGGLTGQPPGGGSLGATGLNSSGDGAHGRIVIMYWQPA